MAYNCVRTARVVVTLQLRHGREPGKPGRCRRPSHVCGAAQVLKELERAAEQQAAAGSAEPAAGQLLDELPPEALRELERSAREAAAVRRPAPPLSPDRR